MRALLISTFIAGFIFSYAMFGMVPGALGAWIGGALFFVLVAWIAARMSRPSIGAAVVAATAALAWIGH